MTPEQLILLSPVLVMTGFGLACYRGRFWAVMRLAWLSFIAIIIALQHLDLLVGLVQAWLRPQLPTGALFGVVFSAAALMIYLAFWWLYRQLWRPEPPQSATNNGARVLYGVIGLGIGWVFGAMLLYGLLVSKVLRQDRTIPADYVDAVRVTAEYVLDRARVFYRP